MTNQGAHYRARENMIKSSLDRNKSMLQIKSQAHNNGYIDLNRANHRKFINFTKVKQQTYLNNVPVVYVLILVYLDVLLLDFTLIYCLISFLFVIF